MKSIKDITYKNHILTILSNSKGTYFGRTIYDGFRVTFLSDTEKDVILKFKEYIDKKEGYINEQYS